MSGTLLSVVMVNFNHGRYIREAVDSVLGQSYAEWELVIVDDGSSDDSPRIAQEYCARYPGKIRMYSHPGRANRGIAASYSLAVRQCRGAYTGFLEADDVWRADNAERKIAALRDGSAGLAYSDVEFTGDEISIRMRGRFSRMFRSLPAGVPFAAFARVLFFNPVPTFSSVVMDSRLLRGVSFDIGRRYEMWLDWFLWLQVSRRAKFVFLPYRLAAWRLRADSYCTGVSLRRGAAGMVLFQLKYRLMLLSRLPGMMRKGGAAARI